MKQMQNLVSGLRLYTEWNKCFPAAAIPLHLRYSLENCFPNSDTEVYQHIKLMFLNIPSVVCGSEGKYEVFLSSNGIRQGDGLPPYL